MSSNRFKRYFGTLAEIFRRFGVFIVAILLVSFGLFFLVSGWDEIAEAFGLIASVNPVWMLFLAVLQLVTLIIAAVTYQVVLRRQGHDVGLLRLLEVHLQRVVIGAVTPIGGPASIYVLVRSLRTHKIPDSDSLIVASVKGMTGVIAFLIFLVPVLLLQSPTLLVTIATVGLFLILAGAIWMSVLVLRQRDLPALVRRWAPERVLTFTDSAKTHRLTATDFLLPTGLSFASHVLTALMLYAGLQAVGYPAAVATVLIGYVVGKLFFMMAPVFQGIGIVEIGMAIALQQAGVPAAVAVSGALIYRVGDLWLPLSWGLLVQLVRMPLLEHSRSIKAQAGEMVRSAGLIARGPWTSFRLRTRKLGQLALVTEAPLALTIGLLMAVAGGLPSVG